MKLRDKDTAGVRCSFEDYPSNDTPRVGLPDAVLAHLHAMDNPQYLSRTAQLITFSKSIFKSISINTLLENFNNMLENFNNRYHYGPMQDKMSLNSFLFFFFFLIANSSFSGPCLF